MKMFEAALDRAVVEATNAKMAAKTQKAIDASEFESGAGPAQPSAEGKMSDPYDLLERDALSDPFTFMNGTKVKIAAD